MESLSNALIFVRKNMTMVSCLFIWSERRFFTKPGNTGYQKYFKFEKLSKCYKFIRVPNGCSDAWRIFTRPS